MPLEIYRATAFPNPYRVNAWWRPVPFDWQAFRRWDARVDVVVVTIVVIAWWLAT